MTYIWNRADKVPEELKPQRISQSFQKWITAIKKEYRETTCEKRRKRILNQINRQTIAYEDSISKYNA